LPDIKSSATPPSYSLPVYRSHDITVVAGANLGDAIADHAHLVLEDVYSLRKSANQTRLSVVAGPCEGDFLIARDSVVGHVGSQIYLDCCITLMSGSGETSEAIIVVETSGGLVEATYLMPLSPLYADQIYALVKFDPGAAKTRFSDIACVSFTRGTHILLADGAQTLVETLQIGDGVMTRDHGVQEIRWIGKQTVRATGEFAPILIRRGALNNSADLTVGPNHRLFFYQRSDRLGAGQAELVVRAGLMVNGDTIVRVAGGFVEYFQLLFDRHEVVYVEGIAAETMLADRRTRPGLPPEVNKSMAPDAHAPRSSLGRDLKVADLAAAKTANWLRRASRG